jgi:hypothetical protein
VSRQAILGRLVLLAAIYALCLVFDKALYYLSAAQHFVYAAF